jgi:23S rRNA (pseudouridine1915-N3)-methyltransferase
MSIRLLISGKLSPEYIKEGVSTYEKRLKFYVPFEIKILPSITLTRSMSAAKLKASESEVFLKNIRSNDFLVLLDEKGKTLTSAAFAGFVELYSSSSREMVFAIGGAHGFDELIKKRADAILSLSSFTLPHQLARLVFMEQLYRAFTIIKKEPYHHI